MVAGRWLCLLALCSIVSSARSATWLRSATVHAGDHHPTRTHFRQLLGTSSCQDERWGPLCGRAQVLLQLQHGHTSAESKRLIAQLHQDGAAISGYLPQDTWLVLGRPDALQPSKYLPHALLPFAPEYKMAPEWHPVMELVHSEQQLQQQRQQLGGAAGSLAAAHRELHKRVVDDELLRPLQLHVTASRAAWEQPPAKIRIGVHFPDLPSSELARLGADVASFHPAEAAAADWAAPLAGVVAADGRSDEHMAHCRPELLAAGQWELDVAVCPQDMAEVLFWLSNQAVVHWLAPRPRLYLQNSVASMIVQDNGAAPDMDYDKPGAHAFWDQGLNGTGQIIGIGDSGIDMHSCFFRDPSAPFEAPADGSKEWKSPNHRKVVYYWGLADNMFRDLVGHGTHTSGSLAGLDPSDPGSKATGAAKGARLAFADLSATASGDVNAPQDMSTSYYPNLFAAGAFVFSDSWGSSQPLYDFQAARVDAWLHANQDAISHFAAGNYGENDDQESTITSPATAKNVVTVGATKSRVANYISQTIAPVFMMTIEIKRTNKASQFMSMRLVKADFGGDGTSLSGRGLPIVRASPPDACAPLQGDAGTYKDAIVLVRRGNCFFSDKMSAGAAAGAAAVVIVNNVAGGYFKMDSQSGGASASAAIPLMALPRRRGEELWALFDNAASIVGTIELYSQTWEAYEDIASFSSFGPTLDGRIKPDVVCPGELTSASSADTPDRNDPLESCGKGRKSGTSMATPIVAGHAAIIRQYFMSGFYPGGSASPAAAYTPSGPLMKAVMMGGACDMKGNTEQYLPLESSPSMRQGYGRLCLCNSLKLAGRCDVNLQVVDRVPISSGETHEYCLASKGGDIRVTLAWYDYPAQPSANVTLVNDLDLTVVSAGMGGQAFFGNMRNQRDSTNSVERVALANVPAGGLDIRVTAQPLSPLTPSQNYSLVVQGAFERQLASPYNPDKAAASLTPGRCPSSLMQSVTESGGPGLASGRTTPAVVVGTGAADGNASQTNSGVVVESASKPAARVEVATPPPTPPPAPAPPAPAPPAPVPPKTPAGGDDLLGLLIGTMTGGPGATPAPAATDSTPAPTGRRLTAWVPPNTWALVCKWLSAPSALLPAPGWQQRHTLGMPAPVAVCGGALLALALLGVVVQSVRRYNLARTASLTTSVNRARNQAAAAACLKQALLSDPSLAAHLDAARVAAAATPATGRKARSAGPSRSHSMSSSSGASSSSAADELPRSAMQRCATTPQPDHAALLAGPAADAAARLGPASSCPPPSSAKPAAAGGVSDGGGGLVWPLRPLRTTSPLPSGSLATAASDEAATVAVDAQQLRDQQIHFAQHL